MSREAIVALATWQALKRSVTDVESAQIRAMLKALREASHAAQ